MDGTFGLYLGWVAVAVCANVTATLVEQGVTPAAPVAAAIAVAVLVVVVGVAAVVLARTGRRWTFAAAAAWGLSWIAVGRLTDEPSSVATGVAAAIAAVVVLSAVWMARRSAPAAVDAPARSTAAAH